MVCASDLLILVVVVSLRLIALPSLSFLNTVVKVSKTNKYEMTANEPCHFLWETR